MHRTTITITDEQNDWIQELVDSGQFQSRTEVVRFCIQRARSDDSPDRLDELERRVEKVEQWASGPLTVRVKGYDY